MSEDVLEKARRLSRSPIAAPHSVMANGLGDAADEIERLTKLSRELDNELKFACEELAFAYRGIVGGYGLDEVALKERAAYHLENFVKPAPPQT
jgi:hypothetical protein